MSSSVTVLVDRIPHDSSAFTQGLVWYDGRLLESTGLYGQSQVRILDPASGAVLRSVALPPEHFGEGIALLNDRLYQLTWQHQLGYIYNPATLARIGGFSYCGEGWGLATDGRHLIMSDGTDTLRYVDPETFATVRRLPIRSRDGEAVARLNELEYVRGELYANVFQRDSIIRIDPDSGIVTGELDLSGTPLSDRGSSPGEDVLNGIAFDRDSQRLYLTGKRWRSMLVVPV
jgi:glutaminyl-peptide cyclotransferase